MRIAVLGAGGMLGRSVVQAAAEHGHAITTLSRTPPPEVEPGGSTTAVTGDLRDEEAVRRALSGADAVVSCIGWTRGREPRESGDAMRNVVRVMHDLALRRLIAISGAGLELPGDRRTLGRRTIILALRVFAANVLAGKQAEWEVIREADVDWTLVRVARMVERPGAGSVVVDERAVLGSPVVAYADVAGWMVDQIADHRWVRKAPFVSA